MPFVHECGVARPARLDDGEKKMRKRLRKRLSKRLSTGDCQSSESPPGINIHLGSEEEKKEEEEEEVRNE